MATKIGSCQNRAPSQERLIVEFCIDTFAFETRYVPVHARAVRDPRELSVPLEHLVSRMSRNTGWRAWIEDGMSWFVQGERSPMPGESPGTPTLHLIFRDNDAWPAAAGRWRRTAPASWELLEFMLWPAGLDAQAVDGLSLTA